MTISFRASTSSSATASASAPPITVPAGVTSTDLSLLFVEVKRGTSGTASTCATPSGWSLLTTATLGATGVANAVDVGNVDIFVFWREGTYTAPTIAITGASSSGVGIYAYARTNDVWAEPVAVTGAQATGASPNTVTGGTWSSAIVGGDVLVVGVGHPGDIGTMSAQTLTQPGVTQGAAASRQNLGVTSGNDSRLQVVERAITSGSSTSAPTFTWTNSSNVPGVAAFVRLREEAFQPPVAPTLSAHGAPTSLSVPLKWTTQAGVTAWDIERNGSVVYTSHPLPEIVDTGLSSSTPYTYRVRASGGPWSTSLVATTGTAPTPTSVGTAVFATPAQIATLSTTSPAALRAKAFADGVKNGTYVGGSSTDQNTNIKDVNNRCGPIALATALWILRTNDTSYLAPLVTFILATPKPPDVTQALNEWRGMGGVFAAVKMLKDAGLWGATEDASTLPNHNNVTWTQYLLGDGGALLPYHHRRVDTSTSQRWRRLRDPTGTNGNEPVVDNSGSNWGAVGRWTHAAWAALTGNQAEFDHAVLRFKKYLGDQTTGLVDFLASGTYDSTWDNSGTVGTALKSGVGHYDPPAPGLDGVVIDDINRGTTPYNATAQYYGATATGLTYPLEAAEYVWAEAALFINAGYEVRAWGNSSSGLIRMNQRFARQRIVGEMSIFEAVNGNSGPYENHRYLASQIDQTDYQLSSATSPSAIGDCLRGIPYADWLAPADGSSTWARYESSAPEPVYGSGGATSASTASGSGSRVAAGAGGATAASTASGSGSRVVVGAAGATASSVSTGAGFAPTITDAVSAIPGITARWRADQITGVADGVGVASWPDMSGNNRPATQATPGSRPTFVAASAINGQPAVRWSGSLAVNFVSAAPTSAQQQTVVAVYRPSVLTGNSRTLRAASASGGIQVRFQPTGEQSALRQGIANLATTSGTNPKVQIDTNHSSIYTVNVDSGSASVSFWLNGVANGTIPVVAATLPTGLTTIIGTTSGGGEQFAGDIAELISFDRILTQTEIDTVNTYIAGRYLPSVVTGAGVATTSSVATSSGVRPSVGAGPAEASSTAGSTGSRITVGAGPATSSASAISTGSRVSVGVGSATSSASTASTGSRVLRGIAAALAESVAQAAGFRLLRGTGASTASSSGTGTGIAVLVDIHLGAATASSQAAGSGSRVVRGAAAAVASALTSAIGARIHPGAGQATATSNGAGSGVRLLFGSGAAQATSIASAIPGVLIIRGTGASTAGSIALTRIVYLPVSAPTAALFAHDGAALAGFDNDGVLVIVFVNNGVTAGILDHDGAMSGAFVSSGVGGADFA